MKRVIRVRLLFIFILCFISILYSKADESKSYSISGHIKDSESGEVMIGASVFIEELKIGTVTNLYGFYSISLPAGRYNIVYSYVGYHAHHDTLIVDSDLTFDVELVRRRELLQPFVITEDKKSENIVSTEMGSIKIDSRTIEKIPALLGEVDVIKAIQLMPGVQFAGEGISGFSVRGGTKDQNLVLLDEAPIFNASHLLGFFSVFNNDAIKEVKIYKGDMPSKYGGRLSSVLEIHQKDGNMKRFEGKGGIGTISSRFTFEGPLIEDRSSFIISGRRSYADLFLKLSQREELKNNKLYFYDLNTKINLIANSKNRLFISAYSGRDVVILSPSRDRTPFRMGWGNNTFTMRWNHLFSPKLFANFSLIYSKYDYRLGIDDNVQGFEWVSMMKNHSFKGDFVYYHNPENTISFGLQSIYHDFWPGLARGRGDETIFGELKIPDAKALEHGFYVSNEQKISDNITFEYGVRYSYFQNIGPGTVYNFDDEFKTVDSTVYKRGKVFNSYGGWEPRVSLVVQINDASSVKSSYNRTMQYIHLASNSTIGSPLDVYMPSSPNILPQSADQISIGYYRNFFNNSIEASVEFYYKQMDNQVDFKDHAELILNPQIEGEVRIAEGEAYGMELLFRKQYGKLTGWMSYTLSRSERTSEWINNGKPYLSPYDRTHDFSIVASYQLNEMLSFAATWVYASGAPVTFPTGRFIYGNVVAPVYSDRNSYRLPPYHRLDLGVTYEPKNKKNRRWKNSWNFSVYNAYNRHNPFVINFVTSENDPNVMEAEMIYLFPIIPAITYNFLF